MKFLYAIKSLLGELLALLIVIATAPINLAYFAAIPKEPGIPILLIHGYLHSSSAWIYLRRKLRQGGCGPIFTINLGSPFQDFDQYALRVASKAKWIEKVTKRSDLLLIGHSMGGVVAMHYTVKYAPNNSVRAVITLGSPLAGTKVAKIGLGACARQMECSSSFIQALEALLKESKNATQFYHLGSLTDLMIIPNQSAFLPQGKCKSWNSIGHIGLLYSPKVAKYLVQTFQRCNFSK